jgi:hypothetical protein
LSKYTWRDRSFYWARATGNENPDACWNWSGWTNNVGYGQLILASGKRIYAHRMAWELASCCPIPDGAFVLHRCDNSKCVNPRHLEIGDQQKNMRDAVARGRLVPYRPDRAACGHEFNARRADGDRYCRECDLLYQRRWRKENRASVLATERKYATKKRATDPEWVERRRARSRAYHVANRDRLLAAMRERARRIHSA